jgi:hypothetical protein
VNAKTYFEEYLPGPQRTVFHTKKGLSWRNAWGVLRYSANNALIAFVHADQMKEQVGLLQLRSLEFSLAGLSDAKHAIMVMQEGCSHAKVLHLRLIDCGCRLKSHVQLLHSRHTAGLRNLQLLFGQNGIDGCAAG